MPPETTPLDIQKGATTGHIDYSGHCASAVPATDEAKEALSPAPPAW